MAKKEAATIEVVVEEAVEKENSLFDAVHKLFLVGFGLVGISQDFVQESREDLGKFFNKLVDRGEEMEKEGRSWLKDVMNRNKKEEEEVAVKVA